MGDVNFFDKVINEYEFASGEFDRFNSPHEGFAILKEKVDELWDKIKKKDKDPLLMEREAIQVGAMALRFLYDCCG